MRRQRRKGGGRQLEIEIHDLGGRGDGQAKTPEGKSLFVPLALPGERLLVRESKQLPQGTLAEILELKQASSDRQEPPCPHFGTCGGCQLQHMKPAAYEAWKQAKAEEALSRIYGSSQKSKSILQPLVRVDVDKHPRNRRRARFAFERSSSPKAKRPEKAVRLGFRAKGSHQLQSIEDCLILEPALLALTQAFKPWLTLALAPGCKGQLQINLLDGPDEIMLADVTLIMEHEPELAVMEAASKLSDICAGLECQLVRVTWQYGQDYATPLLVLQPALHQIEGVALAVPFDAFLQPSTSSADRLSKLVLEGMPPQPKAHPLKVADLFAGIGTFALPVAAQDGQPEVTAFEGFKYALQALRQAVSKPETLSRFRNFQTEQRNLALWPLKAQRLQEFDWLILDPPRSGAKKQCEEIARSSLLHLTYVSCSPATFARDAKVLVEAGFEIISLTPVDQFPWTHHLELVAHFQKQ